MNDAESNLPAAARERRLHGVVTALITPLRPDGELDRTALARLIQRQIEAGIDGIFVLGSVGEGPLLPDRIYAEAAELAAAAAGRARLLLGGASDNSVARCLERLEVLSRAGVAAGVLTLPFYGWPPRVAESVAFFRDVAQRSPIPIVAYDLPKAVGWQMPPDVIAALFELPNVLGLKVTHADFDAMAAVCRPGRRPAHFSVLPGNSRLAARLFQQGADGVVSTPSNVHPEAFVALWGAACAGDVRRLAELDRTVIPALANLIELLPTGAASIKAALEVKGLATRHTVPPWPQASDAEIEVVRRALNEIENTLGRLATDATAAE